MQYNFMPQFADSVADGTKRQTIRARGKRRPPRVGEALQLWTGLRTASNAKRKLLDTVCASVDLITISTARGYVAIPRQRGNEMAWIALDAQEIDALARADGFANGHEFFGFFAQVHGLTFSGYLIKW